MNKNDTGYHSLSLKTLVLLVSRSVGILLLLAAVPLTLWAAPQGVVANSGGTTTFLGSVTVFDLAVSGGAPVTVSDASFNKPRWVAITSDNHFAAVTNAGVVPGNGRITWIALTPLAPSVIGTTNVIPATDVGTNSRVRGIAISGTLAVVAVNDPDTTTENDHVVIVDISCLPDCDAGTPGDQPPGAAQIVATIPLGLGRLGEGVAITADGQFALLAETNGKRLAYVDLTTAPPTLLGTTSLGSTSRPFAVALTPDMKTAVVTNRQDNTLSIVDVSCLPDCDTVTPGNQPPAAPLFTFSVGTNAPQGIAITPDGKRALIAHGLTPGLATVLDISCLPDCDAVTPGNQPPGAAQTSTVPLDKTPFGVGIFALPGGSLKAAIANEDSKTVSVLDLKASPVGVVDTLIPGNSSPRGLAITTVVAPTAKLAAIPKFGKGPLTVTFDGTTSFDPDGIIASCSLDFGDSTPPDTTACAAPVMHVYPSVPVSRKFLAILQVTDNDGFSSTASASIALRANRPPTAVFKAAPHGGAAPLLVTFTDRSHDPDGMVVGFQWDFGDGATSTEQNPTHVYSAPGRFVVTLIVTDDNGVPSVRPRKATITVK